MRDFINFSNTAVTTNLGFESHLRRVRGVVDRVDAGDGDVIQASRQVGALEEVPASEVAEGDGFGREVGGAEAYGDVGVAIESGGGGEIESGGESQLGDDWRFASHQLQS